MGRAYAKVTCVCIWNLDADTCAAAYFNSMPFSSLASLSLSLGGELKRELRGSTTPLSLSFLSATGPLLLLLFRKPPPRRRLNEIPAVLAAADN
jgi:hypothetical protein